MRKKRGQNEETGTEGIMRDADILKDLYVTVTQRRAEHEEGSYTAYLFEKGLDKILKKVAEEAGETLIAAKSLEAAKAGGQSGEEAVCREAFAGEAADLLYHLVVLLRALDIGVDEVEAVLSERAAKTNNLKVQKQVDRNS
jgi:phosphoribosyl-ATP pyrophosphohydrolase